MIALIGLGNPGEKYALTRHNIGYLSIDSILEASSNNQISSNKFNGSAFKLNISNKEIIAFKSNEFMNECGNSISKLTSFYKIKPNKVFVFHDDLDLQLGKIKIKTGGSSAGHNGLKSIDHHYSKNYNRVRMGIGHPGNKDKVLKHVLSNFKKHEMDIISVINDNIAKYIDLLIKDQYSSFMNKIKIK